MFISVGNFINSGRHVKENCRPAALGVCARGRSTVTNHNNCESDLKQALKSS